MLWFLSLPNNHQLKWREWTQTDWSEENLASLNFFESSWERCTFILNCVWKFSAWTSSNIKIEFVWCKAVTLQSRISREIELHNPAAPRPVPQPSQLTIDSRFWHGCSCLDSCVMPLRAVNRSTVSLKARTESLSSAEPQEQLAPRQNKSTAQV